MNVALHAQRQRLDVLSLCTGGGGLDLGLELALPGARAVCMVEREAFAVAHLVAAMRAGLVDEAPIWSDARTFDGRAWRGCVDGLIGGIPCQPHSVAGERKAEDDERDLWSTARRILVQSRPWFVVIENVGGMFSSGGAARVWRDLQRSGFEVEIGLFTAAETGASHERERLFILGVHDTLADARRAGLQRRELGRAPDKVVGESAPGSTAELRPSLFPPGPSDLDRWRAILSAAPDLEPSVCRMADGLAAPLDAIRMLGNGVVPLEAGYAVRTLATRLARRSTGASQLVRMMSYD